MDRVRAWRKSGGDRGGLKNRLDLLLGADAWTTPSEEQLWDSKIITLGSEGLDLRDFEQVLTKGRPEYSQLREKWDLGDGRDEEWGKVERSRAKKVLWDFAKVKIQVLHQGGDGMKGLGVAKISDVILSETGFKLPPTTMSKQMQIWKSPIRGIGGSSSLIKPRFEEAAGFDHPVAYAFSSVSSDPTLTPVLDPQNYADLNSPPQSKKQRLGNDQSQVFVPQSALPSCQPQASQEISLNEVQSRIVSLEKLMAAQQKVITVQNDNYKRLSSASESQAKSFDGKITAEKIAREKAVKELEAKIHGLQEQNAQLEREISRLERKIRDLLQIIKALESENKELTSKLDQLKRENCFLQQQLCEKRISLEKNHLVVIKLFDQLKTKIKTLSNNKGIEPLDQQIKILDRALSYVSIDESSREVRIDLGYHEDLESRKSINFVPLSFQSLVRLNADIDLSKDSPNGVSAKRFGIIGRASSVNGAIVGEPPRLNSDMDTNSSTGSTNPAIEAIGDQFKVQSLRLNSMDAQAQLPNANDMLVYVGGADEITENAPDSFQDLYGQIDATMPNYLYHEDDRWLYDTPAADLMS